MGLFVIQTKDSVLAKLKAALENLELHQRNFPSSHLIDIFAVTYLKECISKLEDCDDSMLKEVIYGKESL